MRKISNWTADHNPARILTLALAASLLVLGNTGCQQNQHEADSKVQTTRSEDCQITWHTEPWRAFHSMAERMSRGEPVPQAEREAYGNLPAVASWRQSLAPNVPLPGNVANWLQAPWQKELGMTGKTKRSANRITMSRNYSYSFSRATAIDSLLAEYADGPQSCALAGLLRRWLQPMHIPRPLVINCLPAMSEIRLRDGEVLLDTGALAAGGTDQTNRSIASLLYRNLEMTSGPSPLDLAGEPAVAACMQLMMNEGVAGWIEQTTSIRFDPGHPTLGKVHIVPSDFYRKAEQTFERFGKYLPVMFDDSGVMASRGNGFARDMAGGNSFTQTGIAMAETIVHRLGEDRLHKVRNSVPDFWAAYQEAALANDSPPPPIGTLGVPLQESMTPLPPAIYDPLMALLKRQFR